MSKHAADLARQRAYRQKTGNKCTKKYEKSPRGFLMRTYRNMQSRVQGVQWRKAHLYEGLPILSRDAFYEWAWDDHNFWRLYKQWVQAGYERRLTPSINRIDTYKGYNIGNIEWLTFSANCSLGASSPKRKSNKVENLLEVLQHVQGA
jgi:hypothetical protein